MTFLEHLWNQIPVIVSKSEALIVLVDINVYFLNLIKSLLIVERGNRFHCRICKIEGGCLKSLGPNYIFKISAFISKQEKCYLFSFL